MAVPRRSIAARGFTAFLGAAVLLLGAPTTALGKPLIAGTKEIRLVTTTTGAGSHPTLQWKPVRDAVEYRVVVQTPKGDPYWTWRGTETRIRFGGGPIDASKRTEGATLTGKKVWFVVAFDANGDAIGSSSKRKIAA
jgi:hypothetical protein